MSLKTLCPIIAVSCTALVLLLPAETEACWLFDSCFHRAPPVCAPACPTPMATQVNYVPQTCYRTVYSPVAVTSYRPVCSTDPCTGCPVTSMAPTTTYVQRPVVVPYTTYRPVVTTVAMPVAPACPCSACGAGVAPATSYYAPATSYYAPAAAAPSCGCGMASAATTGVTSAYYAPATGYYGGAQTSYYASAPATNYGATTTYYPPNYTTTSPNSTATTPTYTTTTPTYSTTSPSTPAGSSVISGSSSVVSGGTTTGGTPNTSYYNGSPSYVTPGPVYPNSTTNAPAGNGPAAAGAVNTGIPMLPLNSNGNAPKAGDGNSPPEGPKQTPIPDSKDPEKSTSSGILKYDPGNRTTSIPTMRPWSYTTVSLPRVSTASIAAKPAETTSDDDGWQPAR